MKPSFLLERKVRLEEQQKQGSKDKSGRAPDSNGFWTAEEERLLERRWFYEDDMMLLQSYVYNTLNFKYIIIFCFFI